MQAIELRSFGLAGLTPAKRSPTTAGDGEVVVRTLAASLNYHDLVTILGFANPRLALPVVPLSDGCGEVIEVGSGVNDLKVGDRIATLFFPEWQNGAANLQVLSRVTGETAEGVLQREFKVAARSVVRVPDHLTPLEAATLPCAALTAWRSLVVEGRVKAGDRVLLQGTGGVSIFALQFAKLLGCEVIHTSSSEEKLERLKALGADHLINYKVDVEWQRRVREITGGIGVDHVVEVGGAGTFQKSLKSLRIGGHLSVIGVLSGVASTVPIAQIMAMNLVVKGITVGNRHDFVEMCRAIALHRLRPEIGAVFPWQDCAAALTLMQQGGHFGKICLDFSA